MAIRTTNAHWKMKEIQRRHWLGLGKRFGVLDDNGHGMETILDGLIARTPGVIADVEANLPKDFPEQVAGPVLRGLGVHDLAYREHTVDNRAVALGLEGSHAFGGDRVRYRPFWNLEYRHALENQGQAAINYVNSPAARDYLLDMRSYNDRLFSVGTGLDVQFGRGWALSVLLGHEQGRNDSSANRIGLSVSYGASQTGHGGEVTADPASASGEDSGRTCRGRRCPRSAAGP
ncbi:autotransporter domain-containing protein [Aerolutibacter ruishenii]|uniref:Autotransporter domain-containing protein n=1 Tax=Aerolutibacter ruishenii TaxID=686800 RepID=A0A562M0Y1_9GAMM|nr:autotransporter domain-containing protein [Lysobacter ruishenii]TWI13576.1 hypothetical protein IP93_00738 [Lysobacter ruishenii]